MSESFDARKASLVLALTDDSGTPGLVEVDAVDADSNMDLDEILKEQESLTSQSVVQIHNERRRNISRRLKRQKMLEKMLMEGKDTDMVNRKMLIETLLDEHEKLVQSFRESTSMRANHSPRESASMRANHSPRESAAMRPSGEPTQADTKIQEKKSTAKAQPKSTPALKRVSKDSEQWKTPTPRSSRKSSEKSSGRGKMQVQLQDPKQLELRDDHAGSFGSVTGPKGHFGATRNSVLKQKQAESGLPMTIMRLL